MKKLEDDAIFSKGAWKKGQETSKEKYFYYSTKGRYTDFECLFASPLCSDSMLYAHSLVKHRLLPGHRAWIGHPDFLSLRLVLEGSEYVRYDQQCFLMEQGDLMIFRPFQDYEFMTGPDGFSEKKSIVIKGTLLHEILTQSNFSGKSCIQLKNPGFFLAAYDALRAQFISTGEPVPSLNAGICFELLQRLSDECKGTIVPPVMDAIRHFIEMNLDGDLSLLRLSNEFGLCPSAINKLFRQYQNRPVHRYIVSRRMERALEFLRTRNCSVKETAERVGFSSQFNFSKEFKKYYGKSPRIFFALE